MIMKRQQQQQKKTYIHETTNNTTHDGLEKEVMHRTWLWIRVWIEIDSKNEHFQYVKWCDTSLLPLAHEFQAIAVFTNFGYLQALLFIPLNITKQD